MTERVVSHWSIDHAGISVEAPRDVALVSTALNRAAQMGDLVTADILTRRIPDEITEVYFDRHEVPAAVEALGSLVKDSEGIRGFFRRRAIRGLIGDMVVANQSTKRI